MHGYSLALRYTTLNEIDAPGLPCLGLDVEKDQMELQARLPCLGLQDGKAQAECQARLGAARDSMEQDLESDRESN